MAAPATTGQLRTKVSEMEIGDYIKMGSVNNAGWKFDNGTVELPANGIPITQSFGNYYFYLIKVAKGLLIADRVAQHTATWDSLNSNKLIQGLPFDSGNIIPTMTSNTSPSGVASASGQVADYTAAWKAFDGKSGTTSYNDGWEVSGRSGWLSYEFSSPKRVTAYSIEPYPNTQTGHKRAPKVWTFEGSNDGGINWSILDSQTYVWVNQSKQTFYISPNKFSSYKTYRINISSNNGDADYLGIGEMNMFETAGILRSLTGGVAYADANGNNQLIYTDGGISLGGWPLNNEWDKLVMGFPVDKIQAGKTLNNVFHIDENVATWCQDTPIIGLKYSTVTASANSRTRRGYYGKLFFPEPSNNAGNWVGFRPVFEYKEV